jgi:hypothetical protein
MSWKDTLGAVAPTLASALGGPLAGAAVSVISKELLGTENSTEDELAAALSTAPAEKLLALKRADYEFKSQIKELDVQDRSNARDMAKNTSIAPQVILSTVYTVGYFLLMFLFLKGDISLPDNLEGEFKILLGIMTMAQGQILNFWFGSSSGSKEKTRLNHE